MIHLAHVSKSFGATRAVDEVSLEVRRGEIVGLVGENGAGKTTLMRIAAGELDADGGSVNREGRAELVHQHFLVVDALTIAENLALTHRGFRFTTRRVLEREAEAIIAATGIELRDVSRTVAELSVGERSKLELIKAIARKPATLILDEPTSVLTPNETEELFRVMRRLAAEGTAVVFISHKLPEVLAVAERIIVMRGGRVVAESDARATPDALVNAMIENPSPRVSGERVAEGRVRGTITAIVGVAGNGQSELAAKLRDEHREAGHIPEDRTRDGIVAQMTIAENLALKSARWNPREAARHAERMIALYSIRASGPRQRAGDLSGGNQQKVILARELEWVKHPSSALRAPSPRTRGEGLSRNSSRVPLSPLAGRERRPAAALMTGSAPGEGLGLTPDLVAAEPTRGLDIEATRFVHEQLRAAAADGAKILLITSDLDEAFALADTIRVIYRGRLSDPLTPAEASTRVASLMAGVA